MKNTGRKTIIVASLIAVGLTLGCSRDPNVRKLRYFQSGQRYLQKHQYGEASIQFQNAIQIDPRYADAHYELAQCLLNLRQWGAAYRELIQTSDLNPDNLKAQIDIGNLLLASRRFDEARDRADSILQKDPDNVNAHILRANALAGLKDVDSSLEEMKTALQLDPSQPQSFLNMGLLQSSAKHSAEAEENFKQAITVDPKSIAGRVALGNFYVQQHRFPEAETQFRQAIELQPKDLSLRVGLCGLFLLENQFPQAEEAAREAKEAFKDNPEGYRILGDLYFRVGDASKALTEYTALYKQHPKDLQLKKNYTDLLYLSGRLPEAHKSNDEILKSNPQDPQGLVQRGQILIAEGHPADAIGPLQMVVKNEPDNALAHYTFGLALDRTGDPGRAEGEWREAVRINPKFIDAQKALAQVAINKKDLDGLSTAAEAMIAAVPNAPDGYVLQALAKSAKHDQVGAEADLKKAIEVAPQNPLGYMRMAEFRAAQKNYPAAEQLYDQALKNDPNFRGALEGLVAVLVQEKQADKALARVDQMISASPQNEQYYITKSNLLLAKQPPQFDSAEAALMKAADLNKTDSTPWVLLAQAYGAQGSLDEAAKAFDAAIQRNSADALTYLLFGALEDRRGDWHRAEELYQKALQVQPEYPLAANNLAYLMLEHGENIDVALSLAQVARRKMPDNPNIADTLAWAYYKKGAYNLAIDLLGETVKKTPNQASHNYHLGLAYLGVNDTTRAKTYLERTLQIDPKYEHRQDIEKALNVLAVKSQNGS